jgi:hypothetical protein
LKRDNTNRNELLVLFSGLLVLAYLLSTFSMKQVHTDVLWYLNMGFNNIQDPHWLTRYSHVFLQKIFLVLFDDPFVALRYFWIFLITSSSGLIYFLIRNISKKSNFINGWLGVLLFLSFELQGVSSGIAWADMTSMFVALVISIIFLLSAKNGHREQKWLLLLGVLFYIA